MNNSKWKLAFFLERGERKREKRERERIFKHFYLFN